ncbi:MAG: TolB family protein [Mangrovibacterium sp.]
MRLIRLLALILFYGPPVAAQYYTTGEDPGGIKWKEINTSHFQLIFPEGYEPRAQKLARTMEAVYAYGYATLNHAPGKISVILHTRTVTSNGLVAWSPKRVEFYTTPNQKIYAQDWLEQLAVHEFRHVVQMDKVQKELPVIFRILFGEQAAAAVVGAYLPFWFIEGDAVMTETTLSKSGRGRLPAFLMQTKAQVVEKGLFSYDKASLGSYKDFVPDRYKFGYWFTGTIREQFGTKVWSEVLEELAGKPLSVNPVNRVLKQQTGFGKEDLYKRIFHEYLGKWKKEIASLEISDYKNISLQNDSYINYRYVNALNDSSFIALRESRDDIDRIVMVKSGRESVVTTPGPVLEESMSVTGNLIIWAEYRTDIRWEHADRSVIVVYDMKNQTRKEFRYKFNLLSPVIAPDMKSFVAVEADFSNNYQLAVFDLKTGKKLAGYATPDNQYFLTPTWDPLAKVIYFSALSSAGKYLGSLTTATGQFCMLTQPDYHDIRNPKFRDGNLYYTSAKTGIDNIFCLNLQKGETSQVTSVPFGADYPSVTGTRIFFSNYSSTGYGVSVQNLNDHKIALTNSVHPATYKLASSLAAQEKSVPDSLPAPSAYPVKSYRKLAHLFNFHSWAPLYINVNDYEVQPGVSFLSQNKLGTASTLVGYVYDPTDHTGKYKIAFDYTGLFPVFSTELSYGNRKSAYPRIINDGSDTISQSYTWKELICTFNTRLPLSFNRGKYRQFLQPETEYNYEKIIQERAAPEEIHDGYYHSLTHRLFFQNMIRKAELDIMPDWGQSLDLYYRYNPGGGTRISDLKAAEATLYFPGILKNHGIRFYNGYQRKGTGEIYTFSDVIRFPRGIGRIRNHKLYTFGADYMMPLCYPDLNFGRFAFLKRLRMSLFYDFSEYESVLYNKDGKKSGIIKGEVKSIGTEMMSDGHFLRLATPISAGLRGIYRPDFKDFRVEFLLSISFNLM